MDKERLIEIADKYEDKIYLKDNPLKFVREYNEKQDIEISAVLSAWLSYGNKKEYMDAIKSLLVNVIKEPTKWLMSQEYRKYKDNYSCLYRMTTWHDFYHLCNKMYKAIYENGDIGSSIGHKYKFPYQNLCELLHGETLIPSPQSHCANYNMNLLLRWMVRKGEYDIGIWNMHFSPDNLIVPCDITSTRNALNLGIITRKDVNKNNAMKITKYAKELFPNDPAKFSFALDNLHKEE